MVLLVLYSAHIKLESLNTLDRILDFTIQNKLLGSTVANAAKQS